MSKLRGNSFGFEVMQSWQVAEVGISVTGVKFGLGVKGYMTCKNRGESLNCRSEEGITRKGWFFLHQRFVY